MHKKILLIDPIKDLHIIKGFSSEIRIRILNELKNGERNISELTEILDTPQSTITTNIIILEKAGLINTESIKASKGKQKICRRTYDEYVISFNDDTIDSEDSIVIEMPVGLFTEYKVTAPCGLCSPKKIIGYLDASESFLEPERLNAGLIWFEKGFVTYKFPNNSLYKRKKVKRVEIVTELSSEYPGTNPNWLSDITLSINNLEIGTWTSPGDYGDRKGKFTPDWWKLKGSQYGLLKTWMVTEDGSFIDGKRISTVTVDQLNLNQHHSLAVKLEVKEDAENIGGLNIFGKGFGNYNNDIKLIMTF